MDDKLMDQAGLTTFRLSTDDLPDKDRVAMWRDHCCRVVMKLDIEPIGDARLEYSILARDLPGVRVMSTASSPVRIIRTREYLADGNGDLVFIINQTGKATVTARGRDVALREGDALLMSASEVKVFDRHSYGGALSFRIPRSILSSMVTYVDDVVMQVIPYNADALKLLAGYAAPLFNDIALATPEFRRTAVNCCACAWRRTWRRGGGTRNPGGAIANGKIVHHGEQQPARPIGRRGHGPSRTHAAQSAAAF